eukprot:4981241-Pyramimonas_sp.AAC.1
MAEHPGTVTARLSRGHIAVGDLPDQMTDRGCDSPSADPATDSARAIPDQAFRDLGRELGA